MPPTDRMSSSNALDVSSQHYENFHRSSNTSWIHSSDYLEFWCDKVIDLLDLQDQDCFLDIGCGDGELTTKISQCVNFSQTPIGVEQDTICFSWDERYLQSEQMLADDFFAQAEDTFDKILLKQVIHHMYRPDHTDVLEKVFCCLNPGGKVLILSMPDSLEYPLFSQAVERFEAQESEFNIIQLEEDLVAKGFSVSSEKITYETTLPKEKYLQAVSERFISTLSTFSDAEMRQGLEELDKDLSSEVHVKDPLIALLAQRPEH
ncbi:MAG: methyltransferase domain-containing protein [Bdellovibrionota bacterium]